MPFENVNIEMYSNRIHLNVFTFSEGLYRPTSIGYYDFRYEHSLPETTVSVTVLLRETQTS